MSLFFRKNKYKNTPTVVDGIKFASKKEAVRYQELLILEKAGKISKLQLQVPFEIVRAQPGFRASYYIADFVYYDENGEKIVEDVKGYKNEVYRLKKKLMFKNYGIKIKET